MADLRHLERSEGQRRTIELLERFDLVEEARSRLSPTPAARVAVSTSR